MNSETITTFVCVDCAMVQVNADYSGMGPDREAEVRSAFQFLALDGYRLIVDTDNLHEFTSQRCAVCDTTLAGLRYDALLEPTGA